MPTDTFVMDPEDITDVTQADDVISRIRQYKEGNGFKEAGVLFIQRRLFSGLYEIVDRNEADEYLTRPILDEPGGPRTCEWGIAFYPLDYYIKLRRRLSGEKGVRLPRPIKRGYYSKRHNKFGQVVY